MDRKQEASEGRLTSALNEGLRRIEEAQSIQGRNIELLLTNAMSIQAARQRDDHRDLEWRLRKLTLAKSSQEVGPQGAGGISSSFSEGPQTPAWKVKSGGVTWRALEADGGAECRPSTPGKKKPPPQKLKAQTQQQQKVHPHGRLSTGRWRKEERYLDDAWASAAKQKGIWKGLHQPTGAPRSYSPLQRPGDPPTQELGPHQFRAPPAGRRRQQPLETGEQGRRDLPPHRRRATLEASNTFSWVIWAKDRYRLRSSWSPPHRPQQRQDLPMRRQRGREEEAIGRPPTQKVSSQLGDPQRTRCSA